MDRPKAPVFNPRRFRLGEVLVSKGLIDDAQLAKALELQKTSGRKPGRALTDLKLATEAQIGEAVADQLGVGCIDLTRHELDPALVLKLPEVHARRYRAIVLGNAPDGLLVGMVDPADMVGFDQLSRTLKTHMVPAVVAEGALLAAIEHIYQRKDEMASFAREVADDVGEGVLSLSGLEGSASADEAPVLKLINSIFESAVTRGVSDIHIEPQERTLQIR